MAQTWRDLLFAHWPVAPEAMRGHIPAGLTLQTFDGWAWLGVTPFVLTGLRGRGLPPVPGLSTFPELNVRTYVTAGDKPGVWFFSLDAGSTPAVWGARLLYSLPYFRAAMRARRAGEGMEYTSQRTHPGAYPAAFAAAYRPVGPPAAGRPGTLDAWLTERYCLYAADRRGRLWRAEIHHAPWPLQRAEAEIRLDTMTAALEIRRRAPSPLLHFAARLDVHIWLPTRAGE
jgi:uncharacterized protein YqjF (DUF2071 family)